MTTAVAEPLPESPDSGGLSSSAWLDAEWLYGDWRSEPPEPPGPRLNWMLETLDVATLDQDSRIDFAAAWERQRAYTDAKALASVVVLVGPAKPSVDLAVKELALALRLSPWESENRAHLARQLLGRFAATHQALLAGTISVEHARAIVLGLANLAPVKAREVEKQVLELAGRHSVGNLKRRMRRLVLVADPSLAKQRAKEAAEERRVMFAPSEDGQACLTLIGPLLGLAAAFAAINTAAGPANPDDPRTADQRRFDAAVDLLTGAQAPQATLVFHAGHDEVGPRLADFMGEPVPAEDLARLLKTGTIKWHDPHIPPPDTINYRPTVAQDRWVRAEDIRCRFPGCTAREGLDLDHVMPYGRGGKTSVWNLICLCRHHHRWKHKGLWTPVIHPDRSVTWTSRTGLIQVSDPP